MKEERNFRITYWLTTPDPTHKSFAIKWRKVDCHGKVIEHGTFKDERTSLLNTLLRAGKKKHSSVESEYRSILKLLQNRERSDRGEVEVLEENQILLNEYVRKKYSSKFSAKAVKDPQAAINESKRAIAAVGGISLISGSAEDIMDAALAFSQDNVPVFNRFINRLRGILRANGLHERADELTTLREPPKEVTQINYKQLAKLVEHIRTLECERIAGVRVETFLSLVQFLFWSGLRIGEAAATHESCLEVDGRALWVKWQIDDDGKKRLPKYDKVRKTHLPKQALPHFYAWIAAPDRGKLDRKQATRKLKEFCKQVFPDPVNHLSLHGLRHSYAMVMLRHFEGQNGKRFTLDDVADFLGDHPWTAKKYYAGFVPDKITFERAVEITDNELIA